MYYCSNCGHVFYSFKSNGWFTVNDRDEDGDNDVCPKCNNPDFEWITEKGVEVGNQPSTPAEGIIAKTKRAIYLRALLAVGWLLIFYYEFQNFCSWRYSWITSSFKASIRALRV